MLLGNALFKRLHINVCAYQFKGGYGLTELICRSRREVCRTRFGEHPFCIYLEFVSAYFLPSGHSLRNAKFG